MNTEIIFGVPKIVYKQKCLSQNASTLVKTDQNDWENLKVPHEEQPDITYQRFYIYNKYEIF